MNEKKKRTILLVVIVMTSILLFLCSGKEERKLSSYVLKKGEPGEGVKEYNFRAQIEDLSIENLEIEVPEREFSREELEKLSKDCREKVIRTMLSDNTELTDITKDLTFFETLDDYPFSFAFMTDVPDKVSGTGTLLTTESFTATIYVKCIYENYSDSFSVKVRVKPGEEVKRRIYSQRITEGTLSDSEKDFLLIPKEIEGKKVEYLTIGEKRDPAFLLLGFVACIGVFAGEKVEKQKEKRRIKEEILCEYPVVLQKMSMYLSSGMNIKGIWQAVYEEGIKKKGKESPFYKQMGISINEQKSGVSEGLTYTRFGERTEIMEIIRFTALLSQNLKKGSSKLKDLLDEESGKAFMEKKQRAVKKGEEAGTKLLIPMMVLLIDVLIMIMVPAFWTM